MRAIKGNKEYTVDEASMKAYQAEGFDILGDDGKVIAYGLGKTVPYAQYMEVKTELEALKAATKKTAKKEE